MKVTILKIDFLSLKKEFKSVEKKMNILMQTFENNGKAPMAISKKVRNIVFRADQDGKIKKSGRRIYVGA